jgi:hypothetical protein
MSHYHKRKGGYFVGTTASLAAAVIGFSAAMLQPGIADAQSNPAAAPPSTATPAAPAPTREQMRERMRERMAERRAEIEKREDKNLTADQVRDIVAGRLAQAGNPNLEVGKVTPKEDRVVAVDIVTKTGALVTTREISTRTGGPALREGRETRAAGERGPGRMRGGRGGDRVGGGRMGGRGPAFSRNGGRGGDFNLAAAGGRPELHLTVDQAKKLAEARLIMLANPNLKVGAVKEKDGETITVDIVAADNSLVVQREVDRRTGRMKRGG